MTSPITQILLGIGLISVVSLAHAGKYADAVGAYLPSENEGCRTTKLFGTEYPDQVLMGVCVPITVILDDDLNPLVQLAVTELTSPEMLDRMILLQRQRQLPTEAFEVEIDEHSGDFFMLVDGSVLEKKGSGYVGYVRYHEEALLYKDSSQWKFCVNGSSFKVEIVKLVKTHSATSPSLR